MDRRVFEKLTRPIRAGPFKPVALDSMYIMRGTLEDFAIGASQSWWAIQLTQSRILYHTPANGKNHGLPLYKPSGATGNGMPTNGFSCLSPAISSAIFWP